MSDVVRSTDIILAGVGGQGAVLASKLLARAAMERGLPVKTAETIGMAQRGGSVFSHVRMGEGVRSPLVGRGRADAIVAFEPAEAVRQLRFVDAKILGFVMTDSNTAAPGRKKYYKKYGYGYNYGYGEKPKKAKAKREGQAP